MTKTPIVIPSRLLVRDLLHFLRTHSYSSFPVVSAGGGVLVGAAGQGGVSTQAPVVALPTPLPSPHPSLGQAASKEPPPPPPPPMRLTPTNGPESPRLRSANGSAAATTGAASDAVAATGAASDAAAATAATAGMPPEAAATATAAWRQGQDAPATAATASGAAGPATAATPSGAGPPGSHGSETWEASLSLPLPLPLPLALQTMKSTTNASSLGTPPYTNTSHRTSFRGPLGRTPPLARLGTACWAGVPRGRRRRSSADVGGGLQLEEAPPAPVVLGVISRWGAQGGLPARVVLKGAYLQVGCPGGPACTCGAQGGLPAGGVPRGACMHVGCSRRPACRWGAQGGLHACGAPAVSVRGLLVGLPVGHVHEGSVGLLGGLPVGHVHEGSVGLLLGVPTCDGGGGSAVLLMVCDGWHC